MSSEPAAGSEQSSFFSSSAGAEVWLQGAARRAQVLGPATELMLDLASVGPGSRVLDVAAGTGEQTLLAARRVGPSGSVLATDISAPMLEAAAQAAQQAGLMNVSTRVMDAQELDVLTQSFDAVISRLGLMFLPDLPAALEHILGKLRPGGKFAAIVWGPADHNPLQVTAGAMARRYGQYPAGVIPEAKLFALGEPDALREALTRAGFRDVATQFVPALRPFASAAEAAGDQLATTPFLSQARVQLPPAERERLLIDFEDALRQFEGPDGFIGPGEVVVGVGTRST